MEVSGNVVNGNLIVYLDGELDDHTSNYTRTEIDAMFEQYRFEDVVFNLKRLTFMDSTGIGVLIGRYKKLRGKHRAFVTAPSKTVDMIFTMAGLYDIMPKI